MFKCFDKVWCMVESGLTEFKIVGVYEQIDGATTKITYTVESAHKRYSFDADQVFATKEELLESLSQAATRYMGEPLRIGMPSDHI